MNQPRCIHVPELLAGRPARIRWAASSESAGYVLECRVVGEPGDFPTGYAVISDGAHEPDSYTHEGLTWRDIHAAALPFSELARRNLTWRSIAALGETIAHIVCTDTIPPEAHLIEYRVKAVGPAGESPYRYSGELPVRHAADATDNLLVQAAVNETFPVVVIADAVRLFPESVTVSYDPQYLCLERLEGDAEVIAVTDGEATLRYAREPDDKAFTGLLALLVFRALQSGESKLRMRSIS